METEIKEQTIVPSRVEFLDDIDNNELLTGKFVRKDYFKDGEVVQIIGVGKSSFEEKTPKWDLYLNLGDDEKILTITGKYITMLKEMYGPCSAWRGQKVYIKANPGEWEIGGKKQTGYELEFIKP